MSKFKTQIEVIDNGNGSYTVEYNVFTPGRKYTEATITKTQIDLYNLITKEVPGVKIEIEFDDAGPGNPLTLNGSIPITTPYVIGELKPFVEVVYKAWDNATQMYVEKGGAIVRGHIPG